MKKSTAFILFSCVSALCGSANAENRTIVMGVNAHDSWGVAAYDIQKAESLFIYLKTNNITSYRVDVEPDKRGTETLTKLVPLSKKYGIELRPMLYVDSNDVNAYYKIALKFAPDIQIWELGNELNLKGIPNFYGNIRQMLIARKGIDMAAAESGKKLETTLNVGAALNGVGLNTAKDTYPFIDTAIQMGLKFDYISFHYYPSALDRRGGWYKNYLNPLRKYRKPVFVNETHCANIYQGDDGNSESCAAVVKDLIAEINTNYSDLVYEINMYEMFDNPAAGAGAEQHFGLMFGTAKPKRAFQIVSSAARTSRIAEKSYTRWANNREAKSDTDFVAGVYAIFSGDPKMDAGLVNTVAKNIGSGKKSRRALVVELLNSDETVARMNAMDNEAFLSFAFEAVLGRQIDSGALTYYAPRLSGKLMTRKQFLNAILACPEATLYLKT